MKKIIKTVVGVLLLGSFHLLQAQQYRFRSYGAAQGFMSRGAESIAQDSSGFLWIGSSNGLFRFDGIKTKQWDFSAYSGFEGKQMRVSDIIVDTKDNIWLATSQGVLRMEPATRKVVPILHFLDVHGKKTETKILTLAVDHSGGAYGVGAEGAFRILPGDTIARQIRVAELPEDESFYRNVIDQDIDGTIYISKANRIYRKLPNEKSFTLFREITETAIKDISCLTIGHNTIWCGNFDHSILMGIDKSTRAYREFIIQKDESPDEPNSLVMSICEINDSTVWAGSYVGFGNTKTSGGVSVIHTNRSVTDRIFATGSVISSGLHNAYVECIYKDHQGSIWVGGIDGVDQYHSTFSDVTVYRPSPMPDEYGIPMSGISDVEADQEGNIWIASKSDGLARIDRSGKVVERIPVEKTHLDQTGFIFGVLACGHDGKLYISSTNAVYEVDTRLPNAFDRHHRIVKSELEGGVTHMLVDAKKNLWISTHMGGIYKIAPDGSEEHYSDEGDEMHLLPSGSVIGLDISGDSILAAIGGSGVIILREGRMPDYSISAEKLSSKGWQKCKVREIKITPQWIIFGTKENGVLYLDRSSGNVKSLTTSEGLLSNIITGIEIDKNGGVWIANGVGLQRFMPGTGKLISYTAQRTLPETGFFNGAHATSADGILYFGNFGHLISIHPDLKEVPLPLSLQLLSVKANGKEVWEGNQLRPLSYDENNIQISFTSQNFVNPADDHYEYYLEGFSKEWLPVESDRMLIFTNLPGGDYLLKLRVSNASSSTAELVIPIYIETAFYNTWWFRLMVIAVIAGLLYLAYRFRIRQLMKVHQLRNDISSDLHDDIGSTLSSVYYSAELLRQQGEAHPELRGKIVDNISTNTRDLVERMRDIVWSIHPEQDAMPEMAARMREYIHRLDLPEGMQIQFDAEASTLKNTEIDMRARRNLFLVFKEALNNAIKYSQASVIQVSLTVHGNKLQLLLLDNGKGFDPNHTIAGNGLRTMKQRMEETGGTLKIVPAHPGTSVTASINLH